MKVLDRIKENEERLDKIIFTIKELEKSIENLKSNQENIILLNKYYESTFWLKDKDAYESKKIKNIKAGVLSEDAIWNMNEELKELSQELSKIVTDIKDK